jgi:hypothetical protein
MRRLILLTSLLLLSTGWVLAQSHSDYGNTSQGTNAVGSDSQNSTSGSDVNQSNTGSSAAPQSNDTDNLGTRSSQSGSMSSQEGQDESRGGNTTTQGGMSSDQGSSGMSSNEQSNESGTSGSMHEGSTSGMHHGTTGSSSARSVTGCLSNDNGQYTLTDQAGNTYQLMGKASTLKAHVGHKVRVKGRVSGGTDTATSKKPESMSGGQGETFHVTSIQHIASSCNMQGGSSSR